MSFINICYSILIRPIELFLELVFSLSLKLVSGYGLAIIVLSVIINTLILPLYKRADMIQDQENEKRQLLEKWVKNIKNSFKGDERFLILQTYYRQNDYKPIYVLRGSFSLLLQIPFFIAGYHFLSNMQSLNGISFLFIRDLGVPDGLLNIGGVSVNIMPVLMTLINLISTIIYTKGKTISLKLQLYITAVVFLVLLYNSPSGLVLYWLSNNTYSCVKNYLSSNNKGKNKKNNNKSSTIINTDIFVLSNLLSAVVIGILIPSSTIKSSPQEFMSAEYYVNPLIYIFGAFLVAFGTFVVWFGIFHSVVNYKSKTVINEISAILVICAITDYIFFGTELGNISSLLQYNAGLSFSTREYIINAAALILVGILIHYIIKIKPVIMKMIIVAGLITVGCFSGINIYLIESEVDSYYALSQKNSSDVEIPLSKDGKNVIVLMLDRALGTQLPYIVEEKPELKKMFDGFTYYRNTLSYGAFTNFGMPVLCGGYEYTPEMMNKRDDLSLEDKHNEALKVMPTIFDKEGYKVTVSDPLCAGYGIIPDLSIYDDYPDIRVFNSEYEFRNELKDDSAVIRIEKIRNRNFFCFSMVKIMPVMCQNILYDNGRYNEIDANLLKSNEDLIDIDDSFIQTTDGLSKSEGIDYFSRISYTVLDNLFNITEIEDNTDNTFLMMCNSLTHEPCLLQEPDYIPSLYVDNTEYDKDLSERYNIDGIKMRMDNIEQVKHYHVNVAALLKVGEWLNHLKESGVYDNTRIIIISDHGRNLNQFDLTLDNGLDVQWFIPLLMVKDFKEKGFKTSDEFMTQADVPTLAFKDLIDKPVNPFTDNEINNKDKYKDSQIVLFSDKYSIQENNGNTFLPGDWYAVKNNVYDLKNWEYIGHH